MQHASLMDIFNAAAGAASPFIQKRAGDLKEQHDLQFIKDAANFATEIQNYTRDHLYDPGSYEGTAEEYQLEYLKKIQNFANEKFDGYIKTNGSDYYKGRIETQRAQSLDALRGYSLLQEDEWRFKQAWTQFGTDARSYMSLPAEKAWTAINAALGVLKKQVQVTPDKEREILEGYRKELMTKKISEGMDGINLDDYKNKPGELDRLVRNTLDGLRGSFGEFMKVSVSKLDESGKPTGETEERAWTFPEQKEFEDRLVDFTTSRLWKKNEEAALTDSARYHEIVEEAIRTGKAELFGKANEIARPYRNGSISEVMRGAKPEGQLFARNYSPGFRARLPGLFPEPNLPKERSGGSGGGASLAHIEKNLNFLVEEALFKYLQGETGFENARQIYEASHEKLYKEAQAMGYEGDRGQFSSDFPTFFSPRVFVSVLDRVAKTPGLKAAIPERMKQFEKAIEGNKDLQKMLGGKYKEQAELLVSEMMLDYADALKSVNWNNFTESQLKKISDEVIGKFASKQLTLIQAASGKSPFEGQNLFDPLVGFFTGRGTGGQVVARREENLAKGAAAIEKSQGLVTTYIDRNIPATLRGPDKNPEAASKGLGVYGTEGKRWIAHAETGGKAKGPHQKAHYPSESEVEEFMLGLKQLNEVDVKRDEQNPALLYQYKDQGIFFRIKQDPKNKQQIIIERQDTTGIRAKDLEDPAKAAKSLSESKWRPVNVNRDWEKPSFKGDIAASTEKVERRRLDTSNADRLREALKKQPGDAYWEKELKRAEKEETDFIKDMQQLKDKEWRDIEIRNAILSGTISAKRAKELFGYDYDKGQSK